MVFSGDSTLYSKNYISNNLTRVRTDQCLAGLGAGSDCGIVYDILLKNTSFSGFNLDKVGSVSLTDITSASLTTVTLGLGTDAGDDFIVGNNSALVVEGDNDNVGIGVQLTTPKIILGDSEPINIGVGTDAILQWDETQAIDSLQLGLNVGNNEFSGLFSLVEDADIGNSGRDPTANFPDPRFRVYSSDETNANDYVEIYHDQTNGFFGSPNGNFIMLALMSLY